MTDVAVLTRAEGIALADCEQRIERGLKTFIEVGQSLAAIREHKLYRTEHETFEAYCQQRWNLKRQRAYELMNAAAVVSEFSDTDLPAPAKESHAAALAKVPEPERAAVWSETVENTNGKPTAKAIRNIVKNRTENPGPSAAAIATPPDGPGKTAAPPVQAVESFERSKRAAERRDARALLVRVVDLLAPVNGSPGFVDTWLSQLGALDDELTDLIKRAADAHAVLGDLVERASR